MGGSGPRPPLEVSAAAVTPSEWLRNSIGALSTRDFFDFDEEEADDAAVVVDADFFFEEMKLGEDEEERLLDDDVKGLRDELLPLKDDDNSVLTFLSGRSSMAGLTPRLLKAGDEELSREGTEED